MKFSFIKDSQNIYPQDFQELFFGVVDLEEKTSIFIIGFIIGTYRQIKKLKCSFSHLLLIIPKKNSSRDLKVTSNFVEEFGSNALCVCVRLIDIMFQL